MPELSNFVKLQREILNKKNQLDKLAFFKFFYSSQVRYKFKVVS